MIVRYYKDKDLSYTSRKRYSILNKEPFYQEEQRSVLLGDGATTTVKTKKDNICDYVTIDDTRWFVTSYVYQNGGQVELYLQRDVVGEFGLDDCYGKIERGVTTSVLRQKKELGLNQILKERIKLIPSTKIYGNYSISSRGEGDREMWGIIYLTKPSDGEDNVNINIPELAIGNISDLEPLNNNTRVNATNTFSSEVTFFVRIGSNNPNYFCSISFSRNEYNDILYNKTVYTYSNTEYTPEYITVHINKIGLGTLDAVNDVIKPYMDLVAQSIIQNNNTAQPVYKYFDIPSYVIYENIEKDYNNIILEEEDRFYAYSETSESFVSSGYIVLSKMYEFFPSGNVTINNILYPITVNKNDDETLVGLGSRNNNVVRYQNITKREITSGEAGSISLNVVSNIIDEPYVIYVMPLFNTTITNLIDTYTISKTEAFKVFNKIIQYLSGSSGYLVDAQIYPYCPELNSVVSNLNNLPIFNINSNNYETYCNVQLMPFKNVKKEYISREYAIISPEQSDKFVFDVYDYYDLTENNILEEDGEYDKPLTIKVKTALKPFAIISSAVIQPEVNSLVNLTYDSDLRGSQPSSNGFEVSLSTNQFQEYVRNNSNYQNIFNKNQEYLAKQQQVERTNERVSGVVNTLSSFVTGGIGGYALGNPAVGVASGLLTGAISGVANAIQFNQNEELRKYEYALQQEIFNYEIGTIKNRPNNINRISSFNEIILKDFWYIIEKYECSQRELDLVDSFIAKYSYNINVFDFFQNYISNGRFIKGDIITSNYITNLHNIAVKELKGGIYYYGS